jgi:hypothetical protein
VENTTLLYWRVTKFSNIVIGGMILKMSVVA